MAEQRMVPVELLEDLLEFLLCHSNRWDGHTKHPQLIVEQARAIIDGPGVEPTAEWVKADHGEYPVIRWCSNYIARIGDKLYLAAPSAPVQRLPEGCAWAVTKGGHSICQPPKSWDKQAPGQAVACTPDKEK